MKIYMKNLYSIILAIFNTSFILIALIKTYSIKNINSLEIFNLYLIGVVIFIFLLKISKHRKIFILFLIISIVCFIGFNSNLDIFIKEKIIENIKFAEISMGLGEIIEYKTFKYIFYLLIPLIIILSSILINNNFELMVLLIDFSLVMFLNFCGFEHELIEIRCFFSVICILLICFGMFKGNIAFLNKNNKDKNVNFKYIFTRLIIYCLIVFVIIELMPTQVKGIYYDEINTLNKQQIEQQDEKYAVDEAYNIKKSGYKDSNKKLGGKIILSDEKIMDVYSEEGNLYLRGNVKEFYTGHSWESLNKNLSLFDEIIKDDDKFLNFKDVIEKETIRIVPQDMSINAVFTPIYVSSINCNEKMLKSSRYETLYFYKKNTKPYTIEYYKEKPIYNKLTQKIKNNYKVESSSAYLDISNITKNTLDLTLQLIEGCQNNQEKINKIVEYLEKNYEYSLDVAEIKDETEFVDNFLFKEKKGYCVYFATALAIMARIANIPSRYVEGFKISNEVKNEEKYEVTNKDAHAWVEIIINPEEDLWTTIDCSPTPRSILKDNKDEDNKSNIKNEISSIKEKSTDDKNSSDNKQGSKDNHEDKKQNEEKYSINIKNIFYVTIIILISIVILGIIRIIKSRLKIKKILNTNDPIKIYLYYVSRVKIIELNKKHYETDLEFVERIEEENLKKRFQSLVEKSYKFIYFNSKETVDGKNYGVFIDNYLKERVNVIKYVIYKYILI